jgi:hypothetical protein
LEHHPYLFTKSIFLTNDKRLYGEIDAADQLLKLDKRAIEEYTAFDGKM